MGVGKVLLGAVIGIGAVAAAPFTGGGSVLAGASLAASLAGAGTAAAAAGAAAAGAVSAAAMDEMSKEKYEKEGYQKAASHYAVKTEKLEKEIARFAEKIHSYQKFEEYAAAVYAVSFSVANCDGFMSPEEIDGINEFIGGELYNQHPDELKNLIIHFKNNPPNFNEAMRYIERLPRDLWDVFDSIIELTTHLDNIVRDQEKSYLEAWKIYKTTH